MSVGYISCEGRWAIGVACSLLIGLFQVYPVWLATSVNQPKGFRVYRDVTRLSIANVLRCCFWQPFRWDEIWKDKPSALADSS